MKEVPEIPRLAVIIALLLPGLIVMAAETSSPLQSVSVADVKITDGFWADRIRIVRDKTIEHNFAVCDRLGRIRNFDRIAGKLSGGYEGKFPFDDSDLYKVMEGAAYALMQQRDPELEKRIDDIVARVGAAQRPDGYVDTWYQLQKSIDLRFTREQDDHETYIAGHMIEAAVAYYQATGKRDFLDIAIRFADCINDNFGPGQGKRKDVPGHEEIELALVKLHGVTSDAKYLKLAEWFISQRGHIQGRASHFDYDQDSIPVKDQREIVGHAVRAMYLYCGVADIARITNNQDYFKTMDAIWHDVVDRKMYITAGIGPSAHNEGFTTPYDLPNDTAYAETCAGIGLALWNQRLTLMFADSKYGDILERGMYNGILSGISLGGTNFFYVNPLASRGAHHRQEWFDCPCCPTNIERFIASIGERIYATDGEQILISQYISSDTTIKLKDATAKLSQKTNYPWEGVVKIAVDSNATAPFPIKLRIPSWCANASVSVNGRSMTELPKSRGYVAISRKWGAGDVIELKLPMEVKRVYADPNVKADVGRVAIMRGPVVYCLEGVDNAGALKSLILPKDAPLGAEHRADLLNGVTVVKGRAKAVVDDDSSHDQDVDFTAVPYYAWDNRSPGQMIVWLAEDRSVASMPSGISVSASFVHANLESVLEKQEPKSSLDSSAGNFDWWNRKNQGEWIQYDFRSPRSVSESSVYWFDDTGRGECRIPRSWRLLYKSGDEWKPVTNASEFGIRKDAWNRVTFEPVTTSAIRMEVQLPEKFSAGILRWQVK